MGGQPIRLRYSPDDALDQGVSDLDPARPRTRRAFREPMVVIPRSTRVGETRDAYLVVTQGGAYDVALKARPYCTCPDEEHNSPEGAGCKHRRRIVLLVERGALPAPGDSVLPYARQLRALRPWLKTKQQIAAVEAVDADTEVAEADALADVEMFDHFIDAV